MNSLEDRISISCPEAAELGTLLHFDVMNVLYEVLLILARSVYWRALLCGLLASAACEETADEHCAECGNGELYHETYQWKFLVIPCDSNGSVTEVPWQVTRGSAMNRTARRT